MAKLSNDYEQPLMSNKQNTHLQTVRFGMWRRERCVNINYLPASIILLPSSAYRSLKVLIEVTRLAPTCALGLVRFSSA
ncbi:hypothetical protein VNO77_24062 [Canavalia gladiata]|uniref:Uncharacterized protein n=1 Tax=Canavalia gladiata TaxID=3824 RepID=A0AAN9L6D0_CANGL